MYKYLSMILVITLISCNKPYEKKGFIQDKGIRLILLVGSNLSGTHDFFFVRRIQFMPGFQDFFLPFKKGTICNFRIHGIKVKHRSGNIS